MTFESLLIDTCAILEDTGAVDDGYGSKVPSWTTVAGLDSVPCRLAHSSGGHEVKVGAEVVIAHYQLFIGDVTITEQNRVRVDSIEFEVLLIADRQDGAASHHKECWLEEVR